MVGACNFVPGGAPSFLVDCFVVSTLAGVTISSESGFSSSYLRFSRSFLSFLAYFFALNFSSSSESSESPLVAIENLFSSYFYLINSLNLNASLLSGSGSLLGFQADINSICAFYIIIYEL
jgi:hypothetical protein